MVSAVIMARVAVIVGRVIVLRMVVIVLRVIVGCVDVVMAMVMARVMFDLGMRAMVMSAVSIAGQEANQD